MRYVHTNIIARDWKALAAFYVDVFGCELKPPVRNLSGDWLARGTGVHDAALEGAHLLLPGHGPAGPTLEIFTYQANEDRAVAAPNERGFGHVAFQVEDVEQVLADVVAHGGSALGEVVVREVEGVGQLTFVYARDPEGNVLELQSWA